MTDDAGFSWGLLIGLMAVILTATLVWHKEESICQEEYNVYDCTFEGGMVPVEVEDDR